MSPTAWPLRASRASRRWARTHYTQEDRFFSFRRATHRNEPSYGRQISLIGLA